MCVKILKKYILILIRVGIVKKVAILFLGIIGIMANADAAVSSSRRSQGGAVPASSGSATARSAAVTSRTGNTGASGGVTARAATAGRATVQRATTQTAAAPTAVRARAATLKKVVSTGTKVNTAATNVVVSEECRQKYEGCMDSFCMLENASGGRCMCSDRNAELNDILAEIEKLDQQSYKMATLGVERLEMGDDADTIFSSIDSVTTALMTEETPEEKATRRQLDLALWENPITFEDDNIFDETSSIISDIEGKEGDALHNVSSNICSAQIPECSAELSMLQLMYAQQIKNDCSAYENSLKQQKNASAQKLATAERALRETALEQYRTANKYDLGQCTTEFKKCMINTAGCGADFANCASVSAMDNTNVTKSTSKKNKNYFIKGDLTTIEISASTYDTLIAKKPLCESVTKSCVAVAGQVWDTFLKEIAPQVKSAEIIAEDNVRQGCISSISSCFQKACKDTIDPNDPDGSYDMCLTRPGTMLNVCKIPLNSCGIDAESESAAQQSDIWEFVVARLASMRVDSCTTQVKECLQSTDRCGEDYEQCIGLDTDTIIRMCPYDKLVGCQMAYGQDNIRSQDVYEQLAFMVQGIMLQIDNNLLAQCQDAANTAMITVCGDTQNCNGLVIDDNVGARSLDYKICQYQSDNDSININYQSCRTDVSQIMNDELGRVEIVNNDGQDWVSDILNILLTIIPNKSIVGKFAGVIDGTILWENIQVDDDGKITTSQEYFDSLSGRDDISENARLSIESELATLQNNINNAIAAIEADPTVQFCMTGREVPGMSRSVQNKDGTTNTERTIIGRTDQGRFPNITKQMRAQIGIAALAKAQQNYYKKYDELKNKVADDYITLVERIDDNVDANTTDVRRDAAKRACESMESKTDEWNYKETITTAFNSEQISCHKCVRIQQCDKTKKANKADKRYCKTWADPVETCTDIQF